MQGHGYNAVKEVEMITNTPVEINLDKLFDGRLIPKEEVKELKKQVDELKKDKKYYTDLGVNEKRYPKASFKVLKSKGVNHECTIIEANNRLYAVYNPAIGEGGFGKVKAIQDIESGQWFAYKIQGELGKENLPSHVNINDEHHPILENYYDTEKSKHLTPDEKVAQPPKDETVIDVESHNRVKAIIEPELQILTTLGQSSSTLFSRPGRVKVKQPKTDKKLNKEYRPGTKYSFMMPFKEGVNLHNYIERHTHLSAVKSLDLIIQSIEEVMALHDSGYLHCDIKLDNMKYDAIHHHLSLLDYGLALKLPDEKSTTVSYPGLRGTRGMIAPELKILQKDNTHIYSKETDIYALGIAAQQILDLRIDRSQKDLFTCMNKYSSFNIFDEDFRTFIAKMSDPDPTQRPSLQEVHKKLTELREDYFAISIPIRGIVTFDDCMDALNNNNVEFLQALRATDSIYLHDYPQQYTNIIYTQLRNKLESLGISVESTVLITPNLNDIVANINAKELTKDTTDKTKLKSPHICHIYHNMPVTAAEHPEIENIDAKGKHRHFRDELTKSAHLVPHHLADRIIENLSKLYDNKPNKKPTSRTTQRNNALRNAIQKLNKAKEKNTLTYFQLERTLEILELQFKAKESSRSYLAKTLYTTPTRTRIESIREIKKEVVNNKKRGIELPKMRK